MEKKTFIKAMATWLRKKTEAPTQAQTQETPKADKIYVPSSKDKSAAAQSSSQSTTGRASDRKEFNYDRTSNALQGVANHPKLGKPVSVDIFHYHDPSDYRTVEHQEVGGMMAPGRGPQGEVSTRPTTTRQNMISGEGNMYIRATYAQPKSELTKKPASRIAGEQHRNPTSPSNVVTTMVSLKGDRMIDPYKMKNPETGSDTINPGSPHPHFHSHHLKELSGALKNLSDSGVKVNSNLGKRSPKEGMIEGPRHGVSKPEGMDYSGDYGSSGGGYQYEEPDED